MASLLKRTLNQPGSWVVADRSLLNLLEADGFFRQIEDLEKPPIKGNQVALDQIVAGFDVLIKRKLKQG
ncbi:MAG: hypothetical protein ACOWYE_17620, partial [Desulfatiglandales bacterium]